MIAKIGDTITIDHTFRRPTGDAPAITGTPQYTIRKGAAEVVAPADMVAVSGTRYTATWDTTGQSVGEYIVIATLTADGLSCEEKIGVVEVVVELSNLDAAAVDEQLSATHGAGLWGAASESDTILTQATENTDGDAIGITTPNAKITAYLRADVNRATPKRRTTAETDGEWSLAVEPAAEYTLIFSEDGYLEHLEQVDVE